MCNFFSLDYDLVVQLYFLFKCKNFIKERNNWVKKYNKFKIIDDPLKYQ